ncbi:hypothetical protein BGW38_003925 [Lunasporangiospora selenospora]|uniref:Uncharacterized protein n=1 Tax=Lunasporangiospora selenospora TaxID=979761 RepID=A0A9P6FQV4_9FUNG|nr:hypothetical protein BGW38_003925 [Lunasporangiospora selenospora]
MTAQLPSNVLKYLLPDTRSTIAPSRTALAGRSAAGRFGEDLPRHQSSRELTTGLSRTGPSRVGPVRARTMALSEQGSSSSSSSSSSSTTFKTPLSPVQSPQAYAHSSSYHQQQQHHHHPQHHQQQPQTHPVRSHGLPSMDVVESGGGHSSLRLSSQRTRAFSSNTMTTSAMLQRAPSINLATNGGPQRVVPTTPYTTEGSKPARPSSAVNRLSKVEPLSKVGRISSHSGQGAAEKTTMSASERAKAYSQNLKLEMANRNAHGDGSFRTTMSTRRAVTVDHVPSFGVYGHSSSASSVASTTNTSAATSTTSISPISSASASPTALHSPHNDPLFSSFKAPASPQRHERSSTPPEPTYSPEYVRSTPPPSLPSPSHLSFSGHLEDHPMSEEYVEEEGYVQEKLQSHENLEKIDASNVLEQAAREASVESEHQQARTSLPPTPTKPQLEVPQEAAEDFHQEQYSPQGPHSPQGSHSPQVLYSPQGPNSPKQEQSENQQEQEQEQEQQEQEQAFELHAQA